MPVDRQIDLFRPSLPQVLPPASALSSTPSHHPMDSSSTNITTATTAHDVESSQGSPDSLPAPSVHQSSTSSLSPPPPPHGTTQTSDLTDISTPPNLRTPDLSPTPTSTSTVSPVERPTPTTRLVLPPVVDTQPGALLEPLPGPPTLPALSLETLPDQTLYTTISNTLTLILSRLAASSPDTSTLRLSAGSGRTEEEAGIDREIYLRFMANSRGQIVHRLNTVRRIIAALLSWNEIDWSVPAGSRSSSSTSSRAGVGRLPDGLAVIPGDDGRGERTIEMRGWLDRIDQALEEVRTLGEDQERYSALAFGSDPAVSTTHQQGERGAARNQESAADTNIIVDHDDNNNNDDEDDEDEDEPAQMLSHSLLTGQVSLLRRRGAIHRSSLSNPTSSSTSSSSTFSGVNRTTVPFPRHPASFSALYRQGPRVSEGTFPEEEEDGQADAPLSQHEATWSFANSGQPATGRSKDSSHLDLDQYVLYCYPSSALPRDYTSSSSTLRSPTGASPKHNKFEYHRRLLSPPSSSTAFPSSSASPSISTDRTARDRQTETCGGILSARAFRPSADPKAFMGKEINPVWESKEASGVGLLQDTVWGNMKVCCLTCGNQVGTSPSTGKRYTFFPDQVRAVPASVKTDGPIKKSKSAPPSAPTRPSARPEETGFRKLEEWRGDYLGDGDFWVDVNV